MNREMEYDGQIRKQFVCQQVLARLDWAANLDLNFMIVFELRKEKRQSFYVGALPHFLNGVLPSCLSETTRLDSATSVKISRGSQYRPFGALETFVPVARSSSSRTASWDDAAFAEPSLQLTRPWRGQIVGCE